MARQPEVFVRELDPDQAQRLVKITRTTRDRVRLRRAGVVLASVQGRSAGEIAMMFAASENYVREVIHAFNQQGFAALDPKWSGGRPHCLGDRRLRSAVDHAAGQPVPRPDPDRGRRDGQASGHPGPGRDAVPTRGDRGGGREGRRTWEDFLAEHLDTGRKPVA